MASEREKILQTAQRYVDRKRYDRAIEEYQKLIAVDPHDARTLLKVGDLQTRIGAYPDAVATYDRVGDYYASQGFALKAIAVYKQIRELIRKHSPELADKYAHIVPRLAEIYTQLGLTSDALAAYDEVATRLQRAGRDHEAIEAFRTMVGLDDSNPLPHLRLAEACCRVQALDDAVTEFWKAAELLLSMNRRDDALRVIERILHFRQDARFARAAAELYLQKGTREDGLQALAKLQICFQADPKNIETLALLAQAFTVIGQDDKAIEVYKEMARLARDLGRTDLYGQLLTHLRGVAPYDDQVREMRSISAPGPESALEEAEDVPETAIESLDDEVELIEETAEEEPAASRPIYTSAPDVVMVDDDLEVAEEVASTSHASESNAHIIKALNDADSFRKLRLHGKAVEALHIALEIDPGSFEARHKLRETLLEAGDTVGANYEAINLASMYFEEGDVQNAEQLLYEVLEVEPQHPEAAELLDQIIPAERAQSAREGEQPAAVEPESYSTDQPLPSYDMEELSAAQAMPSEASSAGALTADTPFASDEPFQEASLPNSSAGEDDLMAGLATREEVSDEDIEEIEELGDGDFIAEDPTEAVEEALEASEFFIGRALYDDALEILSDQLTRTPDHPLLLERLREVETAATSSGASQTVERNQLGRQKQKKPTYEDDRAFDIAASLEALDELELPPESAASPQVGVVQNDADIDRVFEKFKAGVSAQVAETDSSTHYDLGVAYKEMGLASDAINEFKLAAKDPTKQCHCFALIGMVHLEQGNLDEAVDAYMTALKAPDKTPEQEMSVHYDLGDTYEMKGDIQGALYYFKLVARKDPNYRGVRGRIEALEPGTAPPARAVNDDDEFDRAFEELFQSK